MEDQTRTWTEAPSSATIRCIIRGYSVLFTLRDETGRDLLPKLTAAIAALEKIGAQAEDHRGNGHKSHASDAGGPRCPVHGSAMTRSKHGGWFCPKRIADDDGAGKAVYCKESTK